MCRSEPHTPARVSLSRIAPGSGSGTGYSRSSNSPPYAFSTSTRPFMGLGSPSRRPLSTPRAASRMGAAPRLQVTKLRTTKEDTVKLLLFDDFRLGVLRGDQV